MLLISNITVFNSISNFIVFDDIQLHCIQSYCIQFLYFIVFNTFLYYLIVFKRIKSNPMFDFIEESIKIKSKLM